MPTVDVERTKRADILQQIAAARFPYPTSEHSNWQTVLNSPEPRLGIQIRGGGWIYPDLAVTLEPGHFIEMLAVVALRHEVTEAQALRRWLPLSKAGALYLYVPTGQAGRANRLCRQLRIQVAGLRTWKRTTAFGVEIVDAYAGPDLFGVVAALLPDWLRPRAYRVARVRIVESYRAPAAAGFEAPAVAAGEERLALPAGGEAPAPMAAAAPAGIHVIPPSPAPILIGAGMILTGLGAIFPAELLGAGLAMMAVGVGGWLREDVLYFAVEDSHSAEAAAEPAAPAAAHGGEEELPGPSLSPFVLGLGLVLTGLGVIFPAELLGAGLMLTGMGVLGWLVEETGAYGRGAGAGHA